MSSASALSSNASGLIEEPPSRPSDSSDLARSSALLELWRAADALDLRAFVGLETFEGTRDLVARVDALATRALALMQAVLHRFESKSEPPPSFGAPERPSGVSANDVGSIAFVAQLELRQCRERLKARAEDGAFATVLGECDRTLRRVRRAIAALDSALSSLLGAPPLIDVTRDLSTSLRVRAGYRMFREQILRLEPPTRKTVTKTLRLVGTSLAIFSGKEMYSELRIGDTLQLRGLQQRILSWLRAEGDEGSPEAGLDLHNDVVAFVTMLQEINRRQELVAHDRSVARVARSYAESHPNGTFPEAIAEELQSLLGASPAIDALLLASPASWDVQAWRAALEVLR